MRCVTRLSIGVFLLAGLNGAQGDETNLLYASGPQSSFREFDTTEFQKTTDSGNAALVVGVPSEDIEDPAGVIDGGAVNIISGSDLGLTGIGSQEWFQVLLDTGNPSAPNDHFGFTLASGDFNGDGYPDLAIGVPGKDIDSNTDAGAVYVVYGNEHGLSAGGSQLWNQNSPGIEGVSESEDRFGQSLTAGDFNGDGFFDLAVGVPGEDVGSVNSAGVVNVLYGSAEGLTATGNQMWSQSTIQIVEYADEFGAVLSTGDFDGDGFDDLVVGVPWEDFYEIGAGIVHVLYGSSEGITDVDADIWSQRSSGISGDVEAHDHFGGALSSGDFNGDAYDDLVVGVPEEDFDGHDNGGVAHVLYGTENGLTATASQLWYEDNLGSTTGDGEQFGYALATGDFDGDAYDDLAVGVPEDNSDRGLVIVIRGASAGLSATNRQLWNQDPNGIFGEAEVGDRFGSALVAGDFDGNGFSDLAVGVPGEDISVSGTEEIDAGMINVICGTSSGLSAVGNYYFHQDFLGSMGSTENGDAFGQTFAVLDQYPAPRLSSSDSRLIKIGETIPVSDAELDVGHGKPSVDIDSQGNFVVASSDWMCDESGNLVSSRWFDSSGQPLSNEIVVSDPDMICNDGEYGTSVSLSDQGAAVVVWDGYSCGLLARAFTGPGTAETAEPFVVWNDPYPNMPDIDRLSGGRLVVTWREQFVILDGPHPSEDPPFQTNGFIGQRLAVDFSEGFSIVGDDIFGLQKYDDYGNAIGPLVNFGSGYAPDVAPLPDGKAVVCWDSSGNVLCQIVGSGGVFIGPEFQANTYSNGTQTWPRLASNRNGDFVVVWTDSEQDGGREALFAQVFDELGNKIGTDREFKVNETAIASSSNTSHPVALNDAGDVVVAWASPGWHGQIYAQRFKILPPPPTPIAGFTWQPLNPAVGDAVQLMDQSTGNPESWEWDIDGMWQPLGQIPPPYSFDDSGPHDVTLKAANPYGDDQITHTISVEPADPSVPWIVEVTRDYPGFFLEFSEGTTILNNFVVTVDWKGNPGNVTFSVDGGQPVYGDVTATGAIHTFDMAEDFEPSLSCSTVSIVATDAFGFEFEAPPQKVCVFPFPGWLEFAIEIAQQLGLPNPLNIVTGNGEVTSSFHLEFPYPHFADGCDQDCAADPACGDCTKIPDWVPLLGGTFSVAETFGTVDGSVSSIGEGYMSLYGETGFFALSGGVFGSASGSGTFRLESPLGLELTEASFTLNLEGVLSKEITVTEIPQFAPLTELPFVGSWFEYIGDRAKLRGEIGPSLALCATLAQDPGGNLGLESGTGTLGLDLAAMLTLDLGRFSLSGWVAGGGSFTLGVPVDPEPLVRAAEIHAQLGVRARLDLLFTFTMQAKLDMGCGWGVNEPLACVLDASWGKSGLLTFDDRVDIIHHDFLKYGEYSRFSAAPVARKMSSKVPVSISETRLVENLFEGASPAIVEVNPGRLLVWEHMDLGDPALQNTEIMWSFDDGLTGDKTDDDWTTNWSTPALLTDDTRAEFTPVLGRDHNGKIVAAWLRIKEENFTDDIVVAEQLGDFYTLLEVVYSVFDPSTQSWGPIVEHTENTAFDTDLRMVSDASGNLLLTWLSNANGRFISDSSNPSDLMYSIWDGSTFSPPAAVDTGLEGVGSHVSAISGTTAVILVPHPSPLDPEAEDIDRYDWNGATWGSASIFAAGPGANRAPTVVYDSVGEGHVVWMKGDDLVKATLSNPTPDVVRPGSGSLAFYGTRLMTNPEGNLTLLWQEAVDNGPADIFAMLYDPASDSWSLDRRLSEKDWLAQQLSAYYGSDGVINAIYISTEINRTTEDVVLGEETWTMTNIPVEGQSDMMLMEHSLVWDLAVTDSDFLITPPSPASGDSVYAALTVHNNGDFAITEQFVVELWVGDPDSNGEFIGDWLVNPTFVAGDSVQLEMHFTYPETAGNLIAVVDRLQLVTEITEANNVATWYIENNPPVAMVIANHTIVEAPFTVAFDGSSSYDPDGDALTFSWAFSDGSPSQTGIQTTHTFYTGGQHPVTLAVTDHHGAVGTAVVVINVLPVQALFEDGFETGDLSAWNAAFP